VLAGTRAVWPVAVKLTGSVLDAVMWLYIMPPNAHSYRLYSSILLSDEVACRCYGSRGEASGSIRDANRTEREPSFYKLDKNPNRTQTMRDLFHLYHFAIMSPLPK